MCGGVATRWSSEPSSTATRRSVHALGRRFLVRVSLTAFEAQLAGDVFMRVHRGVIVNLTRVRGVRDSDSGAVLVLRRGAEVPVSRRNRRKVEEWLARFRSAR